MLLLLTVSRWPVNGDWCIFNGSSSHRILWTAYTLFHFSTLIALPDWNVYRPLLPLAFLPRRCNFFFFFFSCCWTPNYIQRPPPPPTQAVPFDSSTSFIFHEVPRVLLRLRYFWKALKSKVANSSTSMCRVKMGLQTLPSWIRSARVFFFFTCKWKTKASLVDILSILFDYLWPFFGQLRNFWFFRQKTVSRMIWCPRQQ